MAEWINEALSILATSVSVDNPRGLAALFLLAVSADIGIPFPFVLDTILFLTTYQAGPLSLPVFLIVLMLLGGRQLGSGILYGLSRFLGTKFIDRIGKRFPLLLHNLEQFQNRSGRWPILTIIIGRLTPGLMQVSSVAAGTLHFSYYNLVLAIIVSSIIYDGTLITMGFLARLGLENVDPAHSAWIVVSFTAIIIIVLVASHLIRRKSEHD